MYRTDLSTPTAPQDVRFRLADCTDAAALLRLAALDSAAVPTSPLAVAEVGGELVAALSVNGGHAIADPFHRTASLIEMLEVWVAPLRESPSALPPSLAERARGLARAVGLAH